MMKRKRDFGLRSDVTFSNEMIPLTVERQIGGKTKSKKEKFRKKNNSRSAPSIPSKYSDETRNKPAFQARDAAFLCSTERFDDKKNANPGPGTYHKRISYLKNATKCGSVSARGFTAMISMDPRFSDLEELQSALLPGVLLYSISFVLGNQTILLFLID